MRGAREGLEPQVQHRTTEGTARPIVYRQFHADAADGTDEEVALSYLGTLTIRELLPTAVQRDGGVNVWKVTTQFLAECHCFVLADALGSEWMPAGVWSREALRVYQQEVTDARLRQSDCDCRSH